MQHYGARRIARAACNGHQFATSYDTHVLDMSKRINVYVIRYDTVDALRKVRLSKARIARAGHAKPGMAKRDNCEGNGQQLQCWSYDILYTYPPYLAGS